MLHRCASRIAPKCSECLTDVDRWTPGAGGGGKGNNCYTKLCEARGDLYPMLFFAFVITGQLLNSKALSASAASTSSSVMLVVLLPTWASGCDCITEAVLRVCVLHHCAAVCPCVLVSLRACIYVSICRTPKLSARTLYTEHGLQRLLSSKPHSVGHDLVNGLLAYLHQALTASVKCMCGDAGHALSPDVNVQ